MLRCDSVAPLGCPVLPDVYWMLIGSRGFSVARRRRAVRVLSADEQLAPRVAADDDDLLERWAVRPNLLDHRRVVDGPGRRRGDEQAYAGLLQNVLQLGNPVCRVDAHEDRPDLG